MAPELPASESVGFLLGLLVGEGHFGGDGRQPHVVLRMHTRHEAIFRWLEHNLPGGRLYGPYLHGGRRYLQWMARGPYLREVVAPLIARQAAWLDDPALDRFQQMCRAYSVTLPAGEPEPPAAAVGLAPFRQPNPADRG